MSNSEYKIFEEDMGGTVYTGVEQTFLTTSTKVCFDKGIRTLSKGGRTETK